MSDSAKPSMTQPQGNWHDIYAAWEQFYENIKICRTLSNDALAKSMELVAFQFEIARSGYPRLEAFEESNKDQQPIADELAKVRRDKEEVDKIEREIAQRMKDYGDEGAMKFIDVEKLVVR